MPKRIVACAITVFFSLQCIGGAVPIFIESAPPIGKEIFIPESYGVIEKSSFDKYLSSRLVVILKDAHCNYDAQHNIARILEVLVRDYKVDLVAVEGAVGFLDYTKLEKLENETAREKMADSFVKKGIVTGPEYLKITKDGKLLFNIYGIENEKLYIENFTTFRQTIDHMEETLAFVNELDRVVNNLKGKIYLPGLLAFDNKSTRYYENAISLTDWVKELKLEADKIGMTMKEYPNISLTLDSVALEEKIDFKNVEIERANAIGELEKVLSKERLKEMVEKSLQFRLGKIASRDYYDYLEELLKSGDMNPDEKFPNLTRYIQLVKLQSWINSDALFGEVENLEDKIKETMFQNNIQRQLNDISKRARVLSGLFKLTLTREDFEFYRNHKAEFMPSNILSFINIQAPLHNIPVSMLMNDQGFLDKVTSVIADGERFYDIAVQRDMSLVENTLRVMEEKQKSSAVMVIGGFHTDGVLNLFETKGVGYVVISPKIVKAEKEGLYLSLMMDKRIQVAQRSSSLALPKVIAVGEGNERNVKLLTDLGAVGLGIDTLDSMMRFYNELLSRVIPEGEEPLPFVVRIDDSSGMVVVEENREFANKELSPVLLEWFRMGLEEVLNTNPELAEFIIRGDNIKQYIDRSAIIEYMYRTGGARQEGILRRATIGFVTFYLLICMKYGNQGLIGAINELGPEWERFLPETIKAQEFRKGYKWPELRDKLVSGLKGKGIADDVVEGIVNYLFTMPAYERDGKGIYQTQFFNSYLGLVREVFGAELNTLLDQLQAYRYMQIYMAMKYGIEPKPLLDGEDVGGILKKKKATGKTIEILARYMSSGEFREHEERIKQIIGGKGLDTINLVTESTNIRVENERTITDPLKRDLYVAALLRPGIVDLDVPDIYKKKFKGFEERLKMTLPTPDAVSKNDVTIIRACSLYVSGIVAKGDYLEYSDLTSLGLDSIRDAQRANIPQTFLYETDAEKKLMMKKLRDNGIEFTEDHFRHISKFGDIERGKVSIVMLTPDLAKGLEGKKGDRLLIGDKDGTDIMLMDRMALLVAERVDIDIGKIKVLFKDILREYFMGSKYGNEEIDRFIEENISIDEKDILRIKLPPPTPFMREYLESITHERQTLRFA